MYCVKDLVESGGSLQSVPSKYIFPENPEDCIISDAETIPIIDFSLLTSASLKQRSKVIHELGTACREWGFFMVQYICLITNLNNIKYTQFWIYTWIVTLSLIQNHV